MLHFQIEPFKAKVAISVPRVPFNLPEDLVSGTHHPVLTSLTQACHVPLSPSSCLIFSSCLSPVPIEGVETTEKINILIQESIRHSPALTVIEFSCLSKAIVFFYSPGLRLVFESTEIKEEYCQQLPGAVPRHVAKSMLGIIEQLVTHITDEIFSFSISLTNVIRSFLFFSLGKFEQAIVYGREFISGCLDSRHYDRILHSPAYFIAPEVFVIGYLFCRFGFMEDAERAIKVLVLLEKTGYTSAISGLQVLRSIKASVERDPANMQIRLPRKINVPMNPPREQATSSTDPTAAAILALYHQQPGGSQSQEFSPPGQSPTILRQQQQSAPPQPRHQGHKSKSKSKQAAEQREQEQEQQQEGEEQEEEQEELEQDSYEEEEMPLVSEMHAGHSATQNPLSSLTEIASQPAYAVPSRFDPTFSSLASQFPDTFSGTYFPSNNSLGSFPSGASATMSSSSSSSPMTYAVPPQVAFDLSMMGGETPNSSEFVHNFWEQGNDTIISELEAIFHENIF